jgi:chorismate mutase-like protein
MLAKRPTFCNKRLAIVERERDNGELSRGTADVHAYNTHHLLPLLPSWECKDRPECRNSQRAGEGSEKVGCAFIPSQIILTHKAHEFDDIVKETNIMGLDALRDRLDIIDERILSLLSERAKVIVQVANFKRHHNIPIYVPEREVSIIERLRRANPGPLPDETIERIYRNILEEMRKFEGEYSPH